MKLQYLGDSKDSFKWDYLDYLAQGLECTQLRVVPMLTLDDDSGHGSTPAHAFPAQPEILDFCQRLAGARALEEVTKLPAITHGGYTVTSFKSSIRFQNSRRGAYFADLAAQSKQLVFVDPDNGFEPQRCTDKHIRFCEVDGILERTSVDSAVAVFQHFRRVPFQEDFARIRDRLYRGHSTAIYWHSLMFVVVSLSRDIIGRVRGINEEYAKARPVVPLG